MGVEEKGKEFFGRGNPAMDLKVVDAEASFVYGPNGKKYVDFLGGAGVGSLGWKNKEIEEAIRKNERPSYVYPNFYYKPWNDVAEILAEITPGKLQKSFRMTGGSEAVDAALEMAMMYTGREKILSVEGAYHGNTIAALSIGATEKKKKFPNLLNNCLKMEVPLNVEKLEDIETILASKEVAAVIMEPVIVNLGVVIPEEDFMKGVNKLCKKYGTLLIMDEAITGFGRTGKMFASEHFEIEPDILCMAKAITAGHAGMGAVIATEEVASKVEGKIGLYSSYGWHPVSVDASLATLNILKRDREKLFLNISKIEGLFRIQSEKLKFKNEVEIRAKGAAIAIDVKDKKYASEILKKGLQEGLLMNSEGSSLLFLPNFLMEEQTIKDGFEILKKII